LIIQAIPLVAKEINVKLSRILAQVGAALVAGVALSGCVIRPIGWGYRDGQGGGEHHHADSDRGRSPGYDNSRGEPKYRGP